MATASPGVLEGEGAGLRHRQDSGGGQFHDARTSTGGLGGPRAKPMNVPAGLGGPSHSCKEWAEPYVHLAIAGALGTV